MDYTGSSYDTLIRAAIRGTSSRNEAGGLSRRAAALEDAPCAPPLFSLPAKLQY